MGQKLRYFGLEDWATTERLHNNRAPVVPISDLMALQLD